MIIQCRQCRTKFRFADDLMEGDGVWMRCSHCQHVFFQDNPQTVKHAAEEYSQPIEETLPLPSMESKASAAPVSGGDEDVTLFLDNVMKAKTGLEEEEIPTMERQGSSEYREGAAAELPAEDDQQKEEKPVRKGVWKALTIALWIIAVIVIVPVIIYFFVFPQMGDRLLRFANQYVDLGIREPARPEIVAGQVKLQDIRQRMLNNYILGPIRIVEGMAVNQADYPISRIAIKGEIVDAYAVVLGERVTYAGNVLNDEELTALPEEGIMKILSRPEGGSNSNDKIVPNGMIPFMIVFAREPAGVIKTTVKTVGAERLLTN